MENKQKSKYEYFREFEEWYEAEAKKVEKESFPYIITPSDEESLDDV